MIHETEFETNLWKEWCIAMDKWQPNAEVVRCREFCENTDKTLEDVIEVCPFNFIIKAITHWNAYAVEKGLSKEDTHKKKIAFLWGFVAEDNLKTGVLY